MVSETMLKAFRNRYKCRSERLEDKFTRHNAVKKRNKMEINSLKSRINKRRKAYRKTKAEYEKKMKDLKNQYQEQIRLLEEQVSATRDFATHLEKVLPMHMQLDIMTQPQDKEGGSASDNRPPEIRLVRRRLLKKLKAKESSTSSS